MEKENSQAFVQPLEYDGLDYLGLGWQGAEVLNSGDRGRGFASRLQQSGYVGTRAVMV